MENDIVDKVDLLVKLHGVEAVAAALKVLEGQAREREVAVLTARQKKEKDPIVVPMYHIVGDACVSANSGQRLHDEIAPLLHEGRKVVLSFEGVGITTATFLNAAIGQLYGEFSEERIRELLSVEGLDTGDLADLKHVVENAKKYFKNRERSRSNEAEWPQGD